MAEVENEALQAARTKADARLQAAIGELHKAAAEIGKAHSIPEGIQGHSTAELLGRIAWVPGLSRDLARAAGQALAKQELDALLATPAGTGQPAVREVIPPDTSSLTKIPNGLDLADLPGITPAQVKQLKAAGLHQIGDVVGMPDEHLAKVTSWDAKQIGKLRTAIAKASTPGANK